jgi:Protein tyrosine/serine phosphatase
MTINSTCSSGNKNENERILPLEGGFNFRDLGGYKTVSGKTVKWGKVFRSEEMSSLTPSDLDYLNNIPLRTVVDFRSEEEIYESPDKIPASVTDCYELTINPGRHSSMTDISMLTTENGEGFMKEIYCSFVTEKAIIDRYKFFFLLLQKESKMPLLFHCTAGKDRTGMGAALFLASLGVDEETIFEDYILSNKQLEDKYKSIIERIPQLIALLEVRPQYLQAGFDQIKKDHTSIENYILNILGVNIDLMKELYLE